MKKRLISALLALCVAAGLLPMGAAAEGAGDAELPSAGFYSAQILDEEHALTKYSYYDETERIIWCMTDGGFTKEETERLRVVLRSYRSFGETCTKEEPLVTELVRRQGDQERYDIKIDLNEVIPGSEWALDDASQMIELVMCNAEGTEVTVSDLQFQAVSFGEGIAIGDYYIGFVDDGADDTVHFCGSGLLISYGVVEEPRWQIHCSSFRVGAVQKRQTEQGETYYIEDKTAVDITIKRAWIETVIGEQGVLSFSDQEYVSEMVRPRNDQIASYQKVDEWANSLVWIEVEARLGNETQTGRIYYAVCAEGVAAKNIELIRPENDTVEELNQTLEGLASGEDSEGHKLSYVIRLPAITYTGTIQIPEGFASTIVIYGSKDEGTGTILRGGINNGGTKYVSVDNVHFRAQGTEDESALYGGNSCANDCSFMGYDIAIRSTPEYRAAALRGNVFIDNGIALQVDGLWGGYVGSITSSTFINNGTGIQVINSGYAAVSMTYYYRIYNCNFIDNDIDIDAREEGTFYFHRNYCGVSLGEAFDLKELVSARTVAAVNRLVLFRGARIRTGENTKVITNPQWAFPVTKWWHFNFPINTAFGGNGEAAMYRAAAVGIAEEAEYDNYLICDWEKATQVSNEDAGDLILDPSAFEADGEKEISVVDRDENILGTWTFD